MLNHTSILAPATGCPVVALNTAMRILFSGSFMHAVYISLTTRMLLLGFTAALSPEISTAYSPGFSLGSAMSREVWSYSLPNSTGFFISIFDDGMSCFLITAQSLSEFATRSVFPLSFSRVTLTFISLILRTVIHTLSVRSGSIISFTSALKLGCISSSYLLFSCGIFLHAAHLSRAVLIYSAFSAALTSLHSLITLYRSIATSPHSGRSPYTLMSESRRMI